MNTAFREYATRVCFNLTLTRNQIDAFERVAWEVAHWKTFGKTQPYNIEYSVGRAPNFVVAVRKLGTMGLVSHQDPVEMNPPWSKCVWTITPAGEALYTLLLEAGLVRKPIFKVEAA